VEEVAEALAVVEVDPIMWLCLAAVDRQRDFVVAVELWAADACRGRPPDAGAWGGGSGMWSMALSVARLPAEACNP
jgi:hypothetical protein